MKKTLLYLILAVSAANASYGQNNEIYDKGIASLQVVAGDDWMALPVITLGADGPENRINISFDDLTHTYHRYAYKIEHCEADWTVSEELFSSDYVAGFQEGNTIEDYEESVNTNILYTHYKLHIPNERCALKMSGDYINVNDPSSQIKTVVMQNRRWDNARINPKPQYIMPDGLKWEHNRDMIFEAGNEYRKFEILDVSHPTMGIDRIVWDGTDYQAYPYACEPRLNYVYDEDANGAFYIRNSDNIENDVASEYVYVNYVLHTAQDTDGEIYLNGAWTNGQFTPEYRMNYDDTAGCYKASVLQKQGYYSYQFVLVDGNGTSRTVPSEGSFYQTENTYQALVYYRGQGERADRLVGYGHVRIK